jgi:hypothetical protein
MKRRLQLNRRHRLILYSLSLILLLSGAGWAWSHHLDTTGALDELGRRWKPRLLQAHGFAAMGFVLLLGTLLPGHVRRAWHARKNRANGGFFLGAVALLTLSGYALYYLGDEIARNTFAQFHLWLGLISPLLLILHIRIGRRIVRLSRPLHSPKAHAGAKRN